MGKRPGKVVIIKVITVQRKFIYFINPVSGTKSKESLTRLIEKKTRLQNIPYRILQTDKDSNYHYLPSLIRDENITDLIVCGGDGTVSQVASAVQGLPVNIGIIPMGSGNGLALAAGISTNPAKALGIIFEGNASYIDAFYFNEQFSCMLCGIGFDAQVAHDFAKQPVRGLSTYIRQTVKNFFKAEAYPFSIELNDTTIETEAFFISIANSNQFGNNVTIAPKASICDGLIDVVVVNKMSKVKMVYTLLKQVRLGQVSLMAERKFHEHDIFYFQTKELVIKNSGGAPVHIDGEPAATAEIIRIKIIEKAFRLLQPLIF
ncbi:MAG TPA: diacylglycerol kinase family protein [Ferruginibacter sp.]|nr:diacylglycerol kinase family protein [Ferruginibacter sp.]